MPRSSSDGNAQSRRRLGIAGLLDGDVKPLSPLQAVEGAFRDGLTLPDWAMEVTSDDEAQKILAFVDYWAGIGKDGKPRIADRRAAEIDGGRPAIVYSAARIGRDLRLKPREVKRRIAKLCEAGFLVAEDAWVEQQGRRVKAYRLALAWSPIGRTYFSKQKNLTWQQAWSELCGPGFKDMREDLRDSQLLDCPLQSWPGRKFRGVYLPDWALHVGKNGAQQKLLGHVDYLLRMRRSADRRSNGDAGSDGQGKPAMLAVSARKLGWALRKSKSQIWRLVSALREAGLLEVATTAKGRTKVVTGYCIQLNWPRIEHLFGVAE